MFHDLAHKCLVTLHGRLDLPDASPLYRAYPEMPLVSISDAQRRPLPPNVDWLATIPHGLGPAISGMKLDIIIGTSSCAMAAISRAAEPSSATIAGIMAPPSSGTMHKEHPAAGRTVSSARMPVDFAETFAHYLHIVDTLETASAFGIRIRPEVDNGTLKSKVDFDPYRASSIAALINAWLPLTFAVNSLNRSMGQPDLYPFVLSQGVISKLGYIDALVHHRLVEASDGELMSQDR
jgi:hypothetical protein